MSWLLIIILVILVWSVTLGLRKGLIRTIVSTFFLVFVILISNWLTPHVEDFLKDHTKLPEYIEEKFSEFQAERGGESVQESDQAKQDFVYSLPIPDYMRQEIMNDSRNSSEQGTVTFTEYIVSYLSENTLKIISFVIAFILSIILIQIILRAVDVVTDLPIIGFANRLGGAVAGIGRALLWVWFFFGVLTLCSNTTWGIRFMQEIEKDPILNYLYTHNLLMEWIFKE